jgi:dihydrolipoamide dehydrogenase
MANLINQARPAGATPQAPTATPSNGAPKSHGPGGHNFDYDVLVLGGGPGGYPAAIRSAQLGMKVGCIERDNLGGVCLNWGCIPTKALLKNAEIYHNFLVAPKEWGITYDNLKVDFSKVIGRSRDVSSKVVKGIEFLFRKNKVDHIRGNGVITSKNAIEVTDKDGNKKTVTAKNIIIATGGRARQLPGLVPDGKNILSSTEAMIMDHIPESMIVIGAGAIGVEFAYFYNVFGTKITIIEAMPNLLPIEDTEVSVALEKSFKKSGMTIMTKTKVASTKVENGRVKVEVEPFEGGEKKTLEAECILVAIGVQANTENIGLEQLGIKTTKSFIDVDEYMRTSVDGIYAVGDVAGPPLLAHVATHEGIVCAEFIAEGHATPVDYDNIPGCTYCHPQVASVGLTERAAKEKGIEYKVGNFPFTALGKAKAIGETEGFVKLIFEAKYGELIGAHLIGPEVTELLEELVIARSHGATSISLLKTIHAHPTLSEAVMEAAAMAENEAIHF